MSPKKGEMKAVVFKPRSKIWVVNSDGEVLFGSGRQWILEMIHETGSMNKAAAKLGMSYRTLWGRIRETEALLGYQLVENKRSKRCAGSQLTPEGIAMLEKFKEFKKAANQAVDAVFREIF